jgi:hypothetical protein
MPKAQRKTRPSLRSLRRLLIHPRFQIPIIASNLVVILIFFTIAWMGTQNALLDLKPAAGLSGIEVEYFRKYVDYQASQIQHALFLSLGIGVLATAGLTLIITHRLAGPLVRLKNFFQTIVDGKSPIPHLEFRDGDYLRDIEPLVNGAIEKIQESDLKVTDKDLKKPA